MKKGRLCLGVFFIIGAMIYTIIAVMEAAVRAPMAILALLFLVFAFLLLRKRKKKEEPHVWGTAETTTQLVTAKTELIQPEVPQDVLHDMKKHYSKMQAENDARIMRESFKLCQQTYNYDTFFERLQLAQRKALTLLQAKQAGCRIDNTMLKAANSVLSASSALKIDFLGRAYTKETTAAQRLKTPKGTNNKLQNFIDRLKEYETEFMDVEDVYNDVINNTQSLIS